MDETAIKALEREIDQKTLELFEECKKHVVETLEQCPDAGEQERRLATEGWLIQKLAALQVVVLEHAGDLEKVDARLPR